MIKVYKREEYNDVITIVTTPEFKEVVVTSSTGSNCYRAAIGETKYGSMGSYIDSWLKAVEGLQPVVVMMD